MSGLSKQEKERQRLFQEKCQSMLNEMLREDENKYCSDCDAKGPRWASWNLGIFLCIRCAGIHRNLGVHISKVKSVNLDTWTPDQVVSMTTMGNSRGRSVYEANLPDNFRRPQTDVSLENFIRAKYEHKKYIAKEYVPQPAPKAEWNHEIDELLKNKKKLNPLPINNPFGVNKRVNSTNKVIPTTVPVVVPAAVPSAVPAAVITNVDLLGGLTLTEPPPPQISNLSELEALNVGTSQKLTTESILSLYSNQQTNNNPFNIPGNQQPQNQFWK